MFYEIHDSHGMPQCGCDVKRFTEWYDVEEYVEMNPNIMERFDEMYATIIERHEPCYMMETSEYPFYAVVMPDELPGMYRDAIAAGYGDESTFDSWLSDMKRWHILTYHD